MGRRNERNAARAEKKRLRGEEIERERLHAAEVQRIKEEAAEHKKTQNIVDALNAPKPARDDDLTKNLGYRKPTISGNSRLRRNKQFYNQTDYLGNLRDSD